MFHITVLRREEYETLYSKQQATISDLSGTIASAAEIKAITEKTRAKAKIDTAAKESVEVEKQEKPQID